MWAIWWHWRPRARYGTVARSFRSANGDRVKGGAVPAWRAEPESGRAAPAPVSDAVPLFVVRYADEDPGPFWEGTRMLFGRDDQACQLPIWEQINGRALSRVAGELWCAGGQMWVRNLSGAHELVVTGTSSAQVLPARVGAEPGPACSVPAPRATVAAPSTGTWALTVARLGSHGGGADLTLRVENVPDRHRAAADALCAPLLAGFAVPATYAQIGATLGWSERVARRRVEELCAHYQTQVEALPGGRQPGETLTQAVARVLVARNKVGIR